MQVKHLSAILIGLILFGCNDNQPDNHTDSLYKYRNYVSYATTGRISIVNPVEINLARSVTQFEIDQELPDSYIKISPRVKGKLHIRNQRQLIFTPEESLKSGTEYKVTLKLDDFYDDLPRDLNTFAFAFKTITPDFKVLLQDLQSYDQQWQYVEGALESADVIDFAQAPELIDASQGGNKLKITWYPQEHNMHYYPFRIDSINRADDDTNISVAWNGKSIGAKDTKGKNELAIPGRNNFKIVKLTADRGSQPAVTINFSDPIKEQQNFNGLIAIAGGGTLRFEVDGNILHVYPANRVVGDVKVEVFQGIESTYGYKLKNAYEQGISFEQLKPAVRAVSNGVILPQSTITPFYFEAVNLTHVDVRVVKIFESNVLDFLQQNNLSNSTSYNLNKVGRRVAKKTIPLLPMAGDGTVNAGNGWWKVYGVDLSELFNADPGALYRIEISYKPEYAVYNCDVSGSQDENGEGYWQDEYWGDDYQEVASDDEEVREQQYWDNRIYSWRHQVYNWRQEDNPCHPAYYREDQYLSSMLLGSDMGLIVKKGKDNSYLLAATDLVSTAPEPNVSITLFNYQKQPIITVKTDAAGLASCKPDARAAFAMAEKDNNVTYLKIEDGNALSMSNFDISGTTLQEGIKGFMYTERGIHRPGDPIHLTFILNDKENPLPEGHPVKLEVTDARGKLVHREVLNKTNTIRSSVPAKGDKVLSSTRDRKGETTNNFFYFPITTNPTAPTGNWNTNVQVGGASFSKSLKVETIKPNRLKVGLTFDQEVLDASKPVNGNVIINWLHGAPGRNLKIKSDVTITGDRSSFPKYPDYNFYDPIRTFEKIEFNVLDGQVNNEGKTTFTKKLNLSNRAPGMLQGSFVTKAYEGGGDFSLDVTNEPIAPFSHFVGLKSPKARRYGSYFTDEDTNFQVVSTNSQGAAAGNRKLRVKVYRMAWRWWWNRGRDSHTDYESSTTHIPIKDFTITTGANGKSQFTVNIPDDDRGRYLIRVIDQQSGHATGRIAYFYRNWYGLEADSESAKMLIFSADKEKYNTGETATVNFPSGSEGRALISIENGTQVLDSWWVSTQKGETQVKIPITAAMTPNVYVNIALLQPHEQTLNDLPIRLYGVIPLAVEDQNTILEPQIQLPDVLEPESSYTLKVSEKNSKAMTYTLAVVDEGLLGLTRFRTPEIHKHFYSKEALGVKTFDGFDDVIGAYSGSVESSYAIGGGDAAAAAKNRKAERFKPVVTYLGPFALGENETATHTIEMPNYVGAVRAMIVAGNIQNEAFGHTEKEVPVRKPLMVLGSLPRKLSPGEKVTLPVTVFAMEPHVKNAKISIKASQAFKAVQGTTQTVRFTEVGEQIVPFEFEIGAQEGIQNLEIIAEGAGEKATYKIEIDVENPNPYTTTVKDATLEANASQQLAYETFGVLGSNTSSVEFSALPPIDFQRRLSYLIRYPHGCVEQTTSSAFPQLYLNELFDLTFEQKQESEINIKKTIKRLGQFQNSDGGLGYWLGETHADSWGTTYAGHFMIEAQRKGYALPISFLNNWIRYQRKAARDWRPGRYSYNTTLKQAYRLYTLALVQQADLAAMNRLREYRDLSNTAKWRLAGAYALVGQKKIAQELANSASIDFKPQAYHYHSYGSVFRNQAMALEIMLALEDNRQRDIAESLGKKLSSEQWYSTQETSYALLAMSKMVVANGGKNLAVAYSKNGKQNTINTPKAFAARDIATIDGQNTLQLQNNKDNRVYVRLIQNGKLPLGQELSESNKLRVVTSFTDGSENGLAIDQLQQGTEFFATIRVHNDTDEQISNVALTQIFPSGWEIVNTRFADNGTDDSNKARYTDIRDDRVNFYFDLKKNSSTSFKVRLNASYLGTYYLPGSQAEAMYDNTYYARNKGAWVNVKQ